MPVIITCCVLVLCIRDWCMHLFQETDIHGKTVQERVEIALEEIKKQLFKLEGRGRAGSLVNVEVSLHTLEPASMIRQVFAQTFQFSCE